MADLHQGKSINSILSNFAEEIHIRLVAKKIRVVLFMNSRDLGLFELSLIPSCSFLFSFFFFRGNLVLFFIVWIAKILFIIVYLFIYFHIYTGVPGSTPSLVNYFFFFLVNFIHTLRFGLMPTKSKTFQN